MLVLSAQRKWHRCVGGKTRRVGRQRSCSCCASLRIISAPLDGCRSSRIFWDSDVGKWIEAGSYALARCRDADIEAKIDAIVEDLAQAQFPDGYLNCWHIGREPGKRRSNLRDNHALLRRAHAGGRRRLLSRHRQAHSLPPIGRPQAMTLLMLRETTDPTRRFQCTSVLCRQ